MKTISKKKLDELIALERQYWESHGATEYQEVINHADNVAEETSLSSYAIINFVSGIVSTNGFSPDAENEDIYFALRTLGWKVTDDGTEHPAE